MRAASASAALAGAGVAAPCAASARAYALGAWKRCCASCAYSARLKVTDMGTRAGSGAAAAPPVKVHWGYPDPSAGDTPDEEKKEAFRQTLHAIQRRLQLLVNLPTDRLSAMSLQDTARQLAQNKGL